MNVVQLIEQVNSVVDKKGFVVINGRFCSGKSWLINNLGKDIFLVDKREQALKGDEYSIRAMDKWGIRTAPHKVVAVDEAQLMSFKELIEIAELCISTKKGLICVSQQNSSIPCVQFQALLDKNELTSIHIELDGFDTVNMTPISMSFENELVCK